VVAASGTNQHITHPVGWRRQALVHAEKRLEIARQLNKGDLDLGVAMFGLTMLKKKMERWAEALPLLEEQVRVLTRAGPPGQARQFLDIVKAALATAREKVEASVAIE
jgi:hypothetical protein